MTKVPKALQLAYAHEAIIGGIFPYLIVLIEGKSESEVKSLLLKDSTLVRAKWINVAVMTFQQHLNCLEPMHVIEAQPQ